MLIASLLFAFMGVCVKWAAVQYSAGEIVFYRAAVGVIFIAALTRRSKVSLRTAVPGMHFWRSATGVVALMLWFYAHHRLAAGHRDDAQLHVFGVDGAVPGRRRGAGRRAAA
jgi:drug/metabolite transporter (DMT)-like permease